VGEEEEGRRDRLEVPEAEETLHAGGLGGRTVALLDLDTGGVLAVVGVLRVAEVVVGLRGREGGCQAKNEERREGKKTHLHRGGEEGDEGETESGSPERVDGYKVSEREQSQRNSKKEEKTSRTVLVSLDGTLTDGVGVVEGADGGDVGEESRDLSVVGEVSRDEFAQVLGHMAVPHRCTDCLTDGATDGSPEGEEGDGEGDILMRHRGLRRDLRTDDRERPSQTSEDLGETEAYDGRK
jgi:hypothetical protein